MTVLVVGAGPVGLTLALALHRQGLSFRHVDAAAEAARQSRALAIQARTLETLDRLGAVAPILQAALRPEGGVVHLGNSERTLCLSHAVHPRYPSIVILPQDRTERLLARVLSEAGVPPVERGVSLTALDPATGIVRLLHPDGAAEEVRFDRVVGCDGAHSAVRKAAGIGFPGGRYDEQFVLADGHAEGLRAAHLQLYPGNGRPVFLFPLPGGLWRAIAVLPEGTAVPEGDLSVFQRPGMRFFDPTWWSAFRVSHRLADRFLEGRAVIAGDAAHIHSPVGGQGMNLGMQDAASLALALPGGDAAVAEWASRRRAIASRVVRFTDTATGMVLGKTLLTRALRATALKFLPRIPPLWRRAERALAGMDYPPVVPPP
ncbi:FAD-dependent oxidoreductase [Muricoccus radiodurans]|uniref:FAD-dependent oxidoreductase n=1 Tax=Muricoccus radiodurans TaxID=2231721 RepID=UPI003CF4DD6B